jgi:hypothetical protein
VAQCRLAFSLSLPIAGVIAAGCDLAATSRHGYIGPASEPVEGQPIAQMTRRRIRRRSLKKSAGLNEIGLKGD